MLVFARSVVALIFARPLACADFVNVGDVDRDDLDPGVHQQS